jgi:hypothetical protein
MADTLPSLVVNPADDKDFAEAVNVAVSEADRSPETVAATLRADYPNVVVRARTLAGEPFPMWYVYRDGHWVPPGRTNEGA